MQTTIRVRQKIKYRKLLLFGFCSIFIVSSFVVIINLWNTGNVMANQGEIIQVDEQIFTTEMSLPSPDIKFNQVPSSHAVLKQQIKNTPNTTHSTDEK